MSFFRRAGALIARFFTSAADPSAAAGEFQLYSKADGGGVTQLFGRSDNGTVHQITPAAAGDSTCLIFKPGSGETGPVIFDTWAGVYAQLTTLRASANGGGCYTIQFDDSITSPCVVPAGAYDMTDVTWEGTTVSYFPKTPVQVDDNVVLTGMRRFRGVAIEIAGGTTPISDFDPAVYDSMLLVGTDFTTDGAAPVVAITDDSASDIRITDNSHLHGDGPVIALLGISTTNLWVGESSFIEQDSLSIAAGSELIAHAVASSASINSIQADVVGTYTIANATNVRTFPSALYTIVDDPVIAVISELTRIDRSGGGALTVRLPNIPVDGTTRGESVIVKCVTASVAGSLAVVSDGADTIDGAASYVFPATPRHAVTFVSDGVNNWNITASYP